MRGLRRGDAFFLFGRKERTKEKSFAFGLSYEGFAGFELFLEGLFLGEVLLLPFAAGAALEPAAFACFWGAPLTLRLLSFAFRDSANGGYLQSGFSPATCSPLRRLRACSAELVRAPPYIKVERENCLPDAIGRYSHRCIGRARHKLKRARQLHRIIPLLYERLTRSESGASLRMALCGAAAPFLIPHSKHWGGSGSYAIFIPLLHSHCPRSESGVYPRAAVCGAVAAFLISHSEFRIPNF